MEKGPLKTALREVEKESGLRDVAPVDGHRENGSYV
jgi:hypothetical protein